MDRRYRESRFYNGTRASKKQSAQSERIVDAYLEQARRENFASQNYGGSTGGIKSIGSGDALLASRSQDIKNAREIFRAEGSGALGGRANLAELRGFRQSSNGPGAEAS